MSGFADNLWNVASIPKDSLKTALQTSTGSAAASAGGILRRCTSSNNNNEDAAAAGNTPSGSGGARGAAREETTMPFPDHQGPVVPGVGAHPLLAVSDRPIDVEDEAEAALVEVLEKRGHSHGSSNSSSDALLPSLPPEADNLFSPSSFSSQPPPPPPPQSASPQLQAQQSNRRLDRSDNALRRPVKRSSLSRSSSGEGGGGAMGHRRSKSAPGDALSLAMMAAMSMSSKATIPSSSDLGVTSPSSAGAAEDGVGGGRGRPSLATLAMRVRAINKSKRRLDMDASGGGSVGSGTGGGGGSTGRGAGGAGGGGTLSHASRDDGSHASRGSSHASPERRASPFQGVTAAPLQRRAPGGHIFSAADQLFAQAEKVDRLFQIPEGEDEEEDESQPDLGGGEGDTGGKKEGDVEEAGETTPLQYRSQYRTSVQARPGLCARLCSCVHDQLVSFSDVLTPQVLFGHLVYFLRTTFLFGIVPLLAAAYVLFYYCGNPELQFLPLDASVSWWFIFFARQLVTHQLALCVSYIVIDVLALRSQLAINIFGPLVTLSSIQGKGWPATLYYWGLINLLIMHGDHPFYDNWLYFTDIDIFTERNPNGGVMETETYLRILLSMVLAGFAVRVKRTYIALYLGKRTYVYFKPTLEKLLVDILILAEVSDLAAETETPEFADALAMSEHGGAPAPTPSKPQKATVGDKRWADIKFKSPVKKATESVDEESAASESEQGIGALSEEQRGGAPPASPPPADETEQPPPSTKKVEWKAMRATQHDLSDDESQAEAAESDHHITSEEPPVASITQPTKLFVRQESSSIKIRDLLERWEEPDNRLDKALSPSIHDILQFRKALAYMDDTHPFSLNFGPSDTRDHCIKSSQRLYKKLLKFAPGATTLPFDVVGVLAYDDDGILNEAKGQSLVRLFRPDQFDELSLLSFVTSADRVYKKLRYFRASVANSTLIDTVLEQMFNVFFYFILLMTVMSLLNLNPWSLLFSVSTLVVSFAFAVGPSAAKLIEGILLIAVRRPFDLGDRISLCSAESVAIPSPADTWFVEDVNLFYTTLRFAATNEVSSINNGSIANAKIINHARSPKALVTANLMFNIKVTHEQIQIFRSTIKRFVKDRPRIWAGLVFFRINNINADMEFVEYGLRLQHVKPWQDLGPIMINKGELMNYCTEVMLKMGVAYDTPPRSRDVRIKEFRTGKDDEQGESGASSEAVLSSVFSRGDSKKGF